MTTKIKRRTGVKEQGQSLIEFIIVFIFIMAIIITFLRIGNNAVNGYMVHYATFMASRAFLVGEANTANPDHSTDDTIQKKAEAVFDRYMIDLWAQKKGTDLTFNLPGSSATAALYTGVVLKFTQPYALPGLGSGKVDLISESFLGHEPSRAECVKRICEAAFSFAKNLNCSSGTAVHNVTFFDNGC